MTSKMVGGVMKKNPEDEEYKLTLHKVITAHNAKSNDENIVIVKITEVTSQVVAGMKYQITFVGEGETSKTQYNGSASVLSQPWITEEPQLLSIDLQPL